MNGKRLEYLFNFVCGLITIAFGIYVWDSITPIYVALAMIGVFFFSFLTLKHIALFLVSITLKFLQWINGN